MRTSSTFRCAVGPVLLCLVACWFGLPGCSNKADESAAPPEVVDTAGDRLAKEPDGDLFAPDRNDIVPWTAPVVTQPALRPETSPPTTAPVESVQYPPPPASANSLRAAPAPSPPPADSEPRIIYSLAPPAMLPEGTAIRDTPRSVVSSENGYPITRPPVESPPARVLTAESTLTFTRSGRCGICLEGFTRVRDRASGERGLRSAAGRARLRIGDGILRHRPQGRDGLGVRPATPYKMVLRHGC